MPKRYRQSAAEAQERADNARDSSDRHSRDLSKMAERANDAANHLNAGVERRRKREGKKGKRNP